MSTGWDFRPTTLTDPERQLQDEVREFLRQELKADPTYRPGLGMSSRYSPEFSRKLAARGWVGMAIPTAYGGHGRSAVERFIVTEELLAAGAPVAAHWVADRQTAPTLLAFGTEQQKRRFLPAIAAGTCCFSIGMSEREAGSDLASVQTTASRSPDGWRLDGTKMWTGGAHRNDYFVVLCRTSPPGDDRHRGLSQLIVDLRSPGLTVTPIRMLNGAHLFNEVRLDGVLVPDDMVLGNLGEGWQQVTSELAYERSGPDRYLSSFKVLEAYLEQRARPPVPAHAEETVGRLAARLWAIRQLSLSIARAIDEGRSPAVQGSIVKDLGTTFEQEVVAALGELADEELDPDAGDLFESLLAESVLMAPSYTIRGGTTEVLRTVSARALRSSA
jgi:alkylation response protein AidB-like acyl-CoA dehydrogenase